MFFLCPRENNKVKRRTKGNIKPNQSLLIYQLNLINIWSNKHLKTSLIYNYFHSDCSAQPCEWDSQLEWNKKNNNNNNIVISPEDTTVQNILVPECDVNVFSVEQEGKNIPNKEWVPNNKNEKNKKHTITKKKTCSLVTSHKHIHIYSIH